MGVDERGREFGHVAAVILTAYPRFTKNSRHRHDEASYLFEYFQSRCAYCLFLVSLYTPHKWPLADSLTSDWILGVPQLSYVFAFRQLEVTSAINGVAGWSSIIHR